MTERYEGKPFLRLLECYVLDAIGGLDNKQCEALRKMEPQLRKIHGMSGSWVDIVAKLMDFDDTLPDQIRKIWKRNLDRLGKDVVADPEEFAMQFIDQNFPDIVTS